MIPSPQIVEMAGHAGFDWVLIDMEHGTITLTLNLRRCTVRTTGHGPQNMTRLRHCLEAHERYGIGAGHLGAIAAHLRLVARRRAKCWSPATPR